MIDCDDDCDSMDDGERRGRARCPRLRRARWRRLWMRNMRVRRGGSMDGDDGRRRARERE